SMPPVISTIVMLRLFAQRQHASMSAYFTNSLTPPSGFGLLASPRGGDHLGRAARGPVALRKMACRSAPRAGTVISVQGQRLAHRGGAAWSLPLQIGEMDAKTRRPCFAHLPVALLRRRRLDFGLPDFGFGLFCARSSRSRHSLGGPLTWTKTICC